MEATSPDLCDRASPALLARHYAETGPALLAYFGAQRSLASEAEDLLQETFVRALRNPSRLKKAISVRAYLFGIARHVGLDALRRARPTDAFVDVHTAETPSEDPRIEFLRLAIAALPEAQREPLLLKLQQELSYEEIADVLGVPVGTVRSRLHYAVARLHQVLSASEATP